MSATTGDNVASIGRRPKKEVRKEKAKKREDRVDRSLCVKLGKRVDKATLEAVVDNAHSGIDHIFFPRQKFPRFFFVLCKDAMIRSDVRKAIEEIKDETIGLLRVKNGKPKPKVLQISKEEGRKSIDPLTLVLEMIPKELRSEDIKAEFPKCKKVARFNPRRAYVYFKSVEDGLEAFQKLESNKLCGFDVRPKFRKVNCKKAKDHRKRMAMVSDSKSMAAENVVDPECRPEDSPSDLSVDEDSNSADANNDSNNESGTE